MKHTALRACAAAALFVLLTAALLAAARFLLVDDVHSYSRVMLQELYAQDGQIDTLFFGLIPLLPQRRPRHGGRGAGHAQL